MIGDFYQTASLYRNLHNALFLHYSVRLSRDRQSIFRVSESIEISRLIELHNGCASRAYISCKHNVGGIEERKYKSDVSQL